MTVAKTKVRSEPSGSFTRLVGAGGVLANKGVIGATGEKVIAAGSSAVKFLGVAANDAVETDSVTVYRNQVVKVYYSAAANYGDALKVSTSDGQFAPAGSTPDARIVVGRCEETVSGAGLGWAYVGAI